MSEGVREGARKGVGGVRACSHSINCHHACTHTYSLVPSLLENEKKISEKRKNSRCPARLQVKLRPIVAAAPPRFV